MLLVCDPLPGVLDSIWPRVDSLTMDVIVIELTFIDCTVWTCEYAKPLLLTFDEVSHIA